jgi:hypothetical protein
MPKSPRRRSPTKETSVREAFQVLGIPSFGLGLGFAMIQMNFWVGVALMVISLLLIWWLLWRVFTANQRVKRVMGVIISVIVSSVILWSIWIPASIKTVISSSPGYHAPGDDVNGIKWREDYSEVTVIIYNYGETDMLNVDLRIASDLLIAGAGIAPSINNCSSEAVSRGLANIRFEFTDKKSGETREIPLLDKNRHFASSLYRIRCERLSSNSILQIKLPMLTHNWSTGEPKRQPNWAKLWINLMAGNRPIHKAAEQCFAAACYSIPVDASQVPLAVGPTEREHIKVQ